jgi:hypothetical protein
MSQTKRIIDPAPIVLDGNSFSGGLVKNPNYNVGIGMYCPDNQFSSGLGVTTRRFINDKYVISLSPGEGLSRIADNNNYVTSLPISATSDSSGLFYAALDGGSIVSFNINGVSATHTPNNGSASIHADDILSFVDPSGGEYILASYYTLNDWDIARREKSSGTWTDNWLSAQSPTGSADSALNTNKSLPHKLWQGPDGKIYFTNGQFIGQYNPAGGTPSRDALNLGSGWVATAGCSYGIYSAISAYKRTSSGNSSFGRVRVYLWNGSSPLANHVYDIQDNKCGAIYNNNGILHLWTMGRGGTSKTWSLGGYFEGQSIGGFALTTEQALWTGVPQSGGVESIDGAVLFTTNGNFINELRNGIFNRCVSNTAHGFIKNLETTTVYVGIYDSGGYGIATLNQNDYPTGQIFSRYIQLPPKSTIEYVRVFFSAFDPAAKLDVEVCKVGTQCTFANIYDTISVANYPRVTTELQARIYNNIPDITTFFVGLRFNYGVSPSNKPIAVDRIEIAYSLTGNP